MSKEQLNTLKDEDILAAAEQIIAEEIQKSLEAPAVMADSAAPEMSDEDKKKKELEKGCGDMGMDVKKSQADIEGKETGGLAPSVQGSLPGPQGSQGGSESEANKGNHIESKIASEESGPASKETQSGDSEEEANKNKNKKHLMKDGDPAAEGGPASKPTQEGSSQDNAAEGQMFNLMKKSLVEITKALKTLNARVAAVESTNSKPETEEIRKSMQSDVIETLAKSYNKKIRSLESENEELKKSFSTQFEELKKSQDLLAKENQEFKAKLSKPARTRETATAFDAIEKGNSEQTGKIYKSKHEVLEKLEDLRKSGKISGDELITFNASGNMTDNVKKQLAKN